MFWTFAPYIYKNLIEKEDQSEEKAIELTLLWAKTGVTDPEDPKSKKLNLLVTDINLKKQINEKGIYKLSSNPDHMTHSEADKSTKKIANFLVIHDQRY